MSATTSDIERFFGIDDTGALAEPVDVDPVGHLEHVRHVVTDEDHGKTAVRESI